MKKALFIILLFAFLVRLAALNQSLWLDEGVTAKVVSLFSFAEIIPKFSIGDFHPPLYYLFMKIWTGVFGLSVISLRMPSVLFSILTGYVIYKIGTLLKNESVGVWAAVFFLFNPLVMYYSQEARMYMMATFFLTVCLYAFIELRQAKTAYTKAVLLFNGFAFLSFLTFYGSAFFIGSLYLYLLFKKEWKLLLLILPGFLGALLLAAPLLFEQYHNSKEALGLVVNWKQVLGQANLKNLFLIPLKFTVGRISFYPKVVYYLLSGAITFFAFLFVVRGMVRNKFLAFLFLAPLGMGVLFSFFTPLLQYFRFLYLLPILALLLAEGTMFGKKNMTITLRTILLVCYLAFSIAYLCIPAFHREDWKSLAGAITRYKNVYMIPSTSDALVYYAPSLQIHDIRTAPKKNGQEIVIVPYVADVYGLDYHAVYSDKGFHLKKTYTVREIPYEVWQ